MKKNTFIVHFQILFRLCRLERQNEDNLWILSNLLLHIINGIVEKTYYPLPTYYNEILLDI